MRSLCRAAAAALLVVLAALAPTGPTNAAEPIRIGFSMAQTGGLAANGKSTLLAMRMWEEETNAGGGILGRPVQLVYYDDQSNPATVPGIYTKLLDVDKVDLIVSPYATNMIAPAMPIAIQRGLVFIGLFGLAVNDQFRYDRYFHIVPSGPTPRLEYSRGWLDIALSMEPKPKTLAIVGADAEFAKTAVDGARENAKRLGLRIVYDRAYPPSTVDFTAIVRGIQAANPDIVFVASYPPDTVGMIRAAGEIGLRTRMFGGGMIGLQYAAIKQQLGSLLNGIVAWDVYAPEPTMTSPAMAGFLAKYQARAAAEGVDPLGFYTPPYGYAELEVLAQAIEATGGLDQKRIAEYMHKATFHTIIGDVSFGPTGEQPMSGSIFVQYRGVEGNDIDQFKRPGKEVILYPERLKSGTLQYPYTEARH